MSLLFFKFYIYSQKISSRYLDEYFLSKLSILIIFNAILVNKFFMVGTLVKKFLKKAHGGSGNFKRYVCTLKKVNIILKVGN